MCRLWNRHVNMDNNRFENQVFNWDAYHTGIKPGHRIYLCYSLSCNCQTYSLIGCHYQSVVFGFCCLSNVTNNFHST